ncbi:MAG: DUF262 domain-containing protein [Chlorobium sp.]|nr:DUF262 domain-containing protein [Chlorobium sp.]
MRIYPKEPDLYTVYRRIKLGEIDLQPDFQRDLVWNKAKKQSLIDTILREWQFPPVFMVVPSTGETLDVLDGQQRLNAIFEFYEDSFEIDGSIAPLDEKIKRLNGLRYSQLPKEDKARFDRFSVRVFELSDYKQDEPYELFFRLNQGSALTPAEKRNTFYGPVRDQVRALVTFMGEKQLNIERIGFNNNRLSYHDVIARLLFALSRGRIDKKITDSMLVDFFRLGNPVNEYVFSRAVQSIESLSYIINRKVRLNKPTLLTWLMFYSKESLNIDIFNYFEIIREDVRNGKCPDRLLSFLVSIYQEKSSVSVNDAVPVQLRLLVIYLVGLLTQKIDSTSPMASLASRILEKFSLLENYSEDKLVDLMSVGGWGLK